MISYNKNLVYCHFKLTANIYEKSCYEMGGWSLTDRGNLTGREGLIRDVFKLHYGKCRIQLSSEKGAIRYICCTNFGHYFLNLSYIKLSEFMEVLYLITGLTL